MKMVFKISSCSSSWYAGLKNCQKKRYLNKPVRNKIVSYVQMIMESVRIKTKDIVMLLWWGHFFFLIWYFSCQSLGGFSLYQRSIKVCTT